MSCTCNSTPCGCGWGRPPAPACNCPPSPIPPWDRAVQSPLIDTLVQNGTLLLDPDVSYLVATLPNGPFAVVLPNGNYLKQMKRIYVPAASAANSATWVVSGTFSAGYTQLTFNSLGLNAFLEWDGTAWQLISGSCIPA